MDIQQLIEAGYVEKYDIARSIMRKKGATTKRILQ